MRFPLLSSRFGVRPSKQNYLSAALILSISLVSPTSSHPLSKMASEDHQEHCLTSHLRVARTLLDERAEVLSNNSITPELIRQFFPKSVNLEEEPNYANFPKNFFPTQIYYSSDPSNPLPILTLQNNSLSAVPAFSFHNGVVLATGTLEEVKASAPNKINLNDLGPKTVLPGFVEPHLHILLSAMLKGYITDVSPLKAPNFDTAISLLQGALANVKEGEWLVAQGYDPSRTGWQDLLVSELDDKVSSTVPILVINASGHLAYCNTAAFNAAHVTKDSPDPEGGHYARDPDTGDLTGVLVEPGAIEQFAPLAVKANVGHLLAIVKGLGIITENWLSKGVTSIFDAGLGTTDKVEITTVAALSIVSPIRFHGAIANLKTGAAKAILGDEPLPAEGRKFGKLVVKSIKFFTDGSTQGFTAGLNQNYLDNKFPTYFSDKKGWLAWPVDTQDLYNEVLFWMSRGYQIVTHANGDHASDIILGIYDAIYEQHPEYFSDIVHRIEHFTVTHPAQFPLLKKLNVGVSHTMGHVHYWGDTFRDNILGDERAERIGPVKDDVTNGVVYSFNSDSPVTDVGPILWAKTAYSRKIYGSGNTLGEGQKVDLEKALLGITANPAKQILRGGDLGTLEEGKKADFVVFGEAWRGFDWEGGDVMDLPVEETWIGGIRRWRLEE